MDVQFEDVFASYGGGGAEIQDQGVGVEDIIILGVVERPYCSIPWFGERGVGAEGLVYLYLIRYCIGGMGRSVGAHFNA